MIGYESKRKAMSTDNGLLAIGLLTAKSMVLSIFVCSIFMYVMLQVRSATAADLRTVSLVDGDILKIGDIFENAGEKADVVIGRTPMPGQDMRLNARTLMRIAKAANIDWQAQSIMDEVIIRRDANVIGFETLESNIKQALSEKGLTGDAEITINENLSRLTLPKDEPATADIRNVRYNTADARFSATVLAPSAERPLKKYEITGTAHPLVDVPVLNTQIKAGNVISASDLSSISLRQTMVPRGALVNVADLQGMAASKTLYPNKPLRGVDIALPKLVERGGELTIIYESDALLLTAKGKALQNGSRGEMIRVVNLESNKNLQAMVSEDGVVVVR